MTELSSEPKRNARPFYPAAATLRGAVILDSEKTPADLVGRFYPWSRVWIRRGSNSGSASYLTYAYTEGGDLEQHAGWRVQLNFKRAGEMKLACRLRTRAIRLAIEDGSLHMRERVRDEFVAWLIVVFVMLGLFVSAAVAILVRIGSSTSGPMPSGWMPWWGYVTFAVFGIVVLVYTGLGLWGLWSMRPVRPRVESVEVTISEVVLHRLPPHAPLIGRWSELRKVKRGASPTLLFDRGHRVRMPRLELLAEPVKLMASVQLCSVGDPLRPRRTEVWREQLRLAWVIGRTSLPVGCLCALFVLAIPPQAGLPGTRLAWSMIMFSSLLPGGLLMMAMYHRLADPFFDRWMRRERRRQGRRAS